MKEALKHAAWAVGAAVVAGTAAVPVKGPVNWREVAIFAVEAGLGVLGFRTSPIARQ